MQRLQSCLPWVYGVLIVVGLILLAANWGWYSGEESGSTTLRNSGLMVAGFIALVFAYWRSRVADCQAQTSHQALLNERYQKGAEMLGSPVLAVRLGGIYALQDLAEDHPEQYHNKVLELLCAFVRVPPKQTESRQPVDLSKLSIQISLRKREDIRAAVEAIGTRSDADVALEKQADKLVWLMASNLNGVFLRKANLTGAFLVHADLTHAHLGLANLTEVSLFEADLTQTTLSETRGLTQKQLDEACADPDNPPVLGGLCDAETGVPLKWGGKPCRK